MKEIKFERKLIAVYALVYGAIAICTQETSEAGMVRIGVWGACQGHLRGGGGITDDWSLVLPLAPRKSTHRSFLRRTELPHLRK